MAKFAAAIGWLTVFTVVFTLIVMANGLMENLPGGIWIIALEEAIAANRRFMTYLLLGFVGVLLLTCLVAATISNWRYREDLATRGEREEFRKSEEPAKLRETP